MHSQKHQIRQQVLLQCNDLTTTLRSKFEIATLNHLYPLLNTAHSIAVYHAHGYEFRLSPVIDFCAQQGKKIFQPVAYRGTRVMQFEAFDVTRSEIFSLPQYAPSLLIEWYNIDLILLPVMAVDGRGYRLGKGGGYYDTTLAKRKNNLPLLCGVGYSCQYLTKDLPNEDFDVKLDYFASEKGLICFNGK